jgi:Ca2+-binding RTX toxin-like protein
MSADASIIAVGSAYASGGGTRAGRVRIYQSIANEWTQIGDDLNGEASDDESGHAVSLSDDGHTVAIGAPYNDGNTSNSGHVRVFRLTGPAWQQVGEDIDGTREFAFFGRDLSLSADGNSLAVSAPWHRNSASIGRVSVFQFNGTSWSQTGPSIDADFHWRAIGDSISLSSDGQTIAITSSSDIRIFRLDDSQWMSVGQPIVERSYGSSTSQSVSFNRDGRSLAIGGQADDSNGIRAGRVRIFRLDDSGIARPSVSLSVSTDSVVEGDGQTIMVRATSDVPVSGDQSVDLTLTGAAIVPSDFALTDDDPLTPGIQIHIPNGATTGQVSLTFVDNASDEADKTATLKLSSPSAGITVGTNASQLVTIRNDDLLPAAAQQVGTTIFGRSELDSFGESVVISGDGSTIAAASWQQRDVGNATGYVRVFRQSQTGWIQVGSDIIGESNGDRSGVAISLNTDGTVLAIGAPQNDGNGMDSGHVRVFALDDTHWHQMGTDIDGESADNWSGASVSLSADGQRIAIGSPLRSSTLARSGQVRVFEFDGGDWIQLGASIQGRRVADLSGTAVSISDDGFTVAVEPVGNLPLVRAYRFDGSMWNQLGSDLPVRFLNGELESQHVSLSFDGNTLAIGAKRNNSVGTDGGQVQILTFDGSDWLQLGSPIDGDNAFDRAGSSVSVSDDGRTIAIGSPSHSGVTGQVRVFRFDGADWQRFGLDIDAEAQGEAVGTSVSISGDGSLVVVGVPRGRNSLIGFPPGAFRVYQILPATGQTIELPTPDTFHITQNGNTVVVRSSVGQVIASRFIGSEPIRILGSSGNDRIVFETPPDDATSEVLIVVDGQGGDDLIDARNSRNAVSLVGGTGRDTLLGSTGNDTLTGDDGDDSLLGFAGNDRINGGMGNDTLRGGAHRDTLIGEAGDDVLRGNGSSGDVLSGGEGNDQLNGDAGSDLLVETADTNFVLTDTTLTGLGSDQVVGIESARLSGGRSANRIDASGFSGPTVQVGYAGNDTLIGGSAGDLLRGSAGRDRLVGNSGNDRLFGQGTTGDWLDGGPGDDYLNGGSGNDILVAKADANFILTASQLTGDGRDIVRNIERALLTGGRSANRIDASAFAGQTTLNGLGGNDTIIGGAARDVIRGAGGRDILYGMDGNDSLFGQGSSGDRLDGGPGSDRLDGGKGADRISSDGIDTIIEDVLDTILAI